MRRALMCLLLMTATAGAQSPLFIDLSGDWGMGDKVFPLPQSKLPPVGTHCVGRRVRRFRQVQLLADPCCKAANFYCSAGIAVAGRSATISLRPWQSPFSVARYRSVLFEPNRGHIC